MDAPAAGSSDYGVTIGDPDAPHTLVIYEDFLCPACGALEAQTHERLAELADEGNVHVDYRPFELLGRLGDYSLRSASAFGVVLEKSGPGRGEEVPRPAVRRPARGGREPYPDADWLVDKAVEAGANESDVRPGHRGGRQRLRPRGDQGGREGRASTAPRRSCSTASPFSGNFDELTSEVDSMDSVAR